MTETASTYQAPALRPLTRPQRFRLRWALLVGLVLLLGLALYAHRVYAGVEATYAAQDRVVAEAEHAFESIPVLSDEETALLRRSRNARHVELAQRLGVDPPPATRAEADSLIRADSLVRIATDSLYVVMDGEYSVPYLTPSAAASLDSVALRFRDRLGARGLPPFRFSVSSGWRTAADQAALRGDNVNAASGTSSHEYATTYDLTYNPTRYSPAPDALPPPPRIDPRVPGFLEDRVRAGLLRHHAEALDRLADEYPSRLTAALGRALIELEDDSVLVVVREIRQPVYHVTVARRLTDGDPVSAPLPRLDARPPRLEPR